MKVSRKRTPNSARLQILYFWTNFLLEGEETDAKVYQIEQVIISIFPILWVTILHTILKLHGGLTVGHVRKVMSFQSNLFENGMTFDGERINGRMLVFTEAKV